MKRLLFFISLLIGILFSIFSFGQITSKQVDSFYQKYPTIKSSFCDACKEWDNPFYTSIADTERNMPLVTFYIYTAAHEKMQEQLKETMGRSGIEQRWTAVNGQPSLKMMYRLINKMIDRANSIYEIALGHCVAWITLAWCPWGAIASDTYCFNEGAEFQGQNIGTEIATENYCRKLAGWKGKPVTDSIFIWCGTYGSQSVYSNGKVSVTVPTHYYKLIKYNGKTEAWWMPNNSSESVDSLSKRVVTQAQLIDSLGFNPMVVLNSNYHSSISINK